MCTTLHKQQRKNPKQWLNTTEQRKTTEKGTTPHNKAKPQNKSTTPQNKTTVQRSLTFGPNLIKWVNIMYNIIHSCVISNGYTSRYF